MIQMVPLFPITLIAGMYLSGGLNIGFNVTNMESKPRRTRKLKWTEEQCLQLVYCSLKENLKENLGQVSIYSILLTHCHLDCNTFLLPLHLSAMFSSAKETFKPLKIPHPYF